MNQPLTSPLSAWNSANSSIAQHVQVRLRQTLEAYTADPLLVDEHANIERATAQGGYGRRQIYELVQNGADAIPEMGNGRIHVLLAEHALYCANEGVPIDLAGLDVILHSHISMKRGSEIGRFGLGFKSVLGVTDRPEFHSRSGSFGFNAAEAAKHIRQVVPNAERIPVLRVASSLDTIEALRQDPVIADLAQWATSIVKLPLTLPDAHWLPEDIRAFPAEFLLFSPQVSELRLEDRTQEVTRVIRLSKDRDVILLTEGNETSRWKVFSTQHTPSEAAKKDGGELADRETLPLMWAVPLQRRTRRGKFWAFFPTEYYTTLSGILNAPWKTNEDRQNLLTGTFNSELIDVAATLITQNLAHMVDENEPGRFLELLPARGQEAPNWADERLTTHVYKSAAHERSIPNQSGLLDYPSHLRLHPTGLPREALETWAAAPSRPVNWCHPSIEGRDTRSRVERLFNLVGRGASSVWEWLEALVQDKTPEASLAALKVAALVHESNPDARNDIRRARIALTRENDLVEPNPATLFIPRYEAAPPERLALVHPFLVTSDVGKQALEALGIRKADSSSELESILASKPSKKMSDAECDRLWVCIGSTNYDEARKLIREHLDDVKSLRVRTISGKFRPLGETLLPGPVVPADGSRDTSVAIDTKYHKSHLQLIRSLGGISVPQPEGGHPDEEWFETYREEAVARFLALLTNEHSRPQKGYINFEPRTAIGPLDLLCKLSDEGRTAYTEYLLTEGLDEPDWELRHDTRRDAYPIISFEPPALWMVRREGRLRTSLGCLPIKDCIGPTLMRWSRILPVAQCSPHIAERLNLPDCLENLTDSQLKRAWKSIADVEDDLFVGTFYVAICRLVDAPASIFVRIGKTRGWKDPAQVTVVTERNEITALAAIGEPFVIVPSREEARRLIDSWHLRPPEQFLTVEIYAASSGVEVPLRDEYPAFAALIPPEDAEVRLIRCRSIRVETVTAGGRQSEEREVMREGNLVYVSDHLDQAEALDRLATLLNANLSESDREQILEHRQFAKSRARKQEVREKQTLAEKLLEAVGAPAIRRRLPAGLAAAAEKEYGEVSDERAAEIALAVYGVETLQVFRAELERSGLEPPSMWSGSHKARQFVKQLGFPKAFAGFESAKRQPVMDVAGPPHLPPLHEFQELITQEIRYFLRSTDQRRGLLSLPTGAGKTRVTIEALIGAIREEDFGGPLLWVAQSDELCEQAVQTWQYLWRAVGPGSRLRINRLWGTNEADPAEEGIQVVIATIQKLQGCLNDADYEWLRDPSCIVIDEAHHSITKSYTSLLEWSGLGRGAGSRPLIGLTATPFRGGEVETGRLARRYGMRRLDVGVLGEDPYNTLQEMGVLAQVDHQLLHGMKVELKPTELRDLRRTRRLPAQVEGRIGANVRRNEQLFQSILNLPRDWPVLLFAASVDHAQTMAALLRLEGVSAAAISTYTDMRARQYYIEQFRAGELRVLTNFAVLTAGFDAPSIRAIYVARPTYSPVLYQQMIGRGLRGPLNGGKERCLIVNVEDNILQYGQKLAFREFEYLWQSA